MQTICVSHKYNRILYLKDYIYNLKLIRAKGAHIYMKRVVVTGLGALTPIGNNTAEFWSAVKAGILQVKRIQFLAYC